MSRTIAETFEVGGLSVEIHVDEDARDPRREFDHTAVLELQHRRYSLASESGVDLSEVSSVEEGVQAVKDAGHDVVAWLPVYGYDHGQLTLRAGQPFSCQWDSGTAGFAYVTREKMDEGWGKGQWTQDNADACIRSEVAEYDQYLTGDVYGYVVIDPRDEDTLDSCWGMYGFDYAKGEGREAAEHEVKRLVAKDEITAHALNDALDTPDVAAAVHAVLVTS